MFAQIDAEFIFQFNYILLIMIRLIAFKLLQINPTLVTWDVQTWLVTWGVCGPQSKNSIYGESNNF